MLGVVKATGRSHRVDIGSAVVASLPELSFEGATKRNKPNLQVRWSDMARVPRWGELVGLLSVVCVCVCAGGGAGVGSGESCT